MGSHAPSLRLRALIAVAAVGAVAVACGHVRQASAYYEESHVTADDVRVTVDTTGIARIEHALTWRVVAGQPRTIDLVGTEPSAQPEPTSTLESEEGKTIGAIVATLPGRGLRVTLTEPKALRHGQQYHLKVAYSVNLAEAGELVRDGSAFRLVWKGTLPSEGYEGPKVTFSLPPALEAPSALIGEGAMRDDGVAATLKRSPTHDDVELTRPHVGRGEEVVWAVRLDAKAFDGGRSPTLAHPPPPPRHDQPAGPDALAYAVLALLSLAFTAAVRSKDRAFDAAGRASQLAARGLVPLPSWERAAAAGAALFVGLSLQLVDAPLAGAAAIVLAMTCTVLRPPSAVALARTRPARGPGRWLALRPEEVFRPHAGDGSRKLTLFLWTLASVGAVACFFAAGQVLRATQPEAPLFLPLDALVLLPLFTTGTLSQLPPGGAGLSPRHAAWLGRLFRMLVRTKGLRVSPWARVPDGVTRPDEVRILVLPRAPLDGLVGVEVGLAWSHAATSFVATPEVLVRVQEATAAAAKMTVLAAGVMPVPGRKPDERVYRLSPRLPTRTVTAALVKTLARALVDRRAGEEGEWAKEAGATDRRAPPIARAAMPANDPQPTAT